MILPGANRDELADRIAMAALDGGDEWALALGVANDLLNDPRLLITSVEDDLLRRMAARLIQQDEARTEVTEDWFTESEWDVIQALSKTQPEPEVILHFDRGEWIVMVDGEDRYRTAEKDYPTPMEAHDAALEAAQLFLKGWRND